MYISGIGNVVFFLTYNTFSTEQIRSSLYEFNRENALIVFEFINLLLKDDACKVYGGLLANHYWKCMCTDIL
jgi:hypothetical protein